MRQGNNFKGQADTWLPSPIARRLDCIYGVWKVTEWSGNTRAGISALYHIHKNWVQETESILNTVDRKRILTHGILQILLTKIVVKWECFTYLSHLIWRLSLGGRHCYSHFHVKKPSLKVWEMPTSNMKWDLNCVSF